MLLYKYCRTDGINVLKECNLRFSPPSKFNDPFELLPKVTYPRKETLLTIHNTRLSLKESLGQYFGVLSLSYNMDNITMWAHYAEGHKGMVVELETDEIGKMENGKNIQVYKVKYTQKRVPVQFDDKYKPTFGEDLTDLVVTKSNIWAQEDEYRILFKCKEFKMNQDGYYYQPIAPLGIKSVILGCACDKKLVDDVIIELTAERYRHVKLFHAHMDNHDFKLIMFDLTDSLDKFRKTKDSSEFFAKLVTIK